MALDVYVQPTADMPRISDDYEHICSFIDNEGYYWFLYPLFEKLKEETGEYIDLCGAAIFGGNGLDALARTVNTARKRVAEQPEVWEVVTGIITEPVHEEIRLTVNKQQMVMLLDKLEDAVDHAKATRSYVTFWGD